MVHYGFFLAVHIGRIAKVVMVLGGLYPRMRDVPDSIPYDKSNFHLH